MLSGQPLMIRLTHHVHLHLHLHLHQSVHTFVAALLDDHRHHYRHCHCHCRLCRQRWPMHCWRFSVLSLLWIVPLLRFLICTRGSATFRGSLVCLYLCGMLHAWRPRASYSKSNQTVSTRKQYRPQSRHGLAANRLKEVRTVLYVVGCRP